MRPLPLVARTTALAFVAVAAVADGQANPTAGGSTASDPTHRVQAALGHDRALVRRSERNTGAARDWSVPVGTTRGTCYEVIGLARGASRVALEVHARTTRVGVPVSLATSDGAVARGRFCADLPGHVYSLVVHADGPTEWSLAVHTAPAEEAAPDPGLAARERLAVALAGGGSSSAAPGDAGASSDAAVATAASYPVGGTETDYVGNQIRSTMQGRTARAMVPAARWTLHENESQIMDVPLVASHCIIAVIAGVPSVSDYDVQLADPAGNRVAQDTSHHGTETVSYCPSYSGTYHLTVRAVAGFGITAAQVFEGH